MLDVSLLRRSLSKAKVVANHSNVGGVLMVGEEGASTSDVNLGEWLDAVNNQNGHVT